MKPPKQSLVVVMAPLLVAAHCEKNITPPPTQPHLLTCDDAHVNYHVVAAGRYTIHQKGSARFGVGAYPVTLLMLCVEGPHQECWPLRNGAAIGDVFHKSLDTSDHLTLWRRDSNGSGSSPGAMNCGAPTSEARWVDGTTSAAFVLTPEQ